MKKSNLVYSFPGGYRLFKALYSALVKQRFKSWTGENLKCNEKEGKQINKNINKISSFKIKYFDISIEFVLRNLYP